MEHIIYITIAAVIAGAQSWNEIAEFGKSKLDFFKSVCRGWRLFQAMTPSIVSFYL
ncbi:transposase family protein [Segatella copri]|uniref:transposase family protein n=1 Tax=Segatella copri TaxID=165179 RepID=UPI001F41D01A|nr:transposase family protein [Segatella copri]